MIMEPMRVGEFEKVSMIQFANDMKNTFGEELTLEMIRMVYDRIKLPERATVGSAGYDFKTPLDFTLEPGESIKIPTGIRVKISDGWMLSCFPRSGLGFKYRLQLDNTVGIIDSDYYYSSNEGHIFVKLTNDGKSGKAVSVKAGDSFAQGIFIPFGITYSDNASGVRDGGFGSTDK